MSHLQISHYPHWKLVRSYLEKFYDPMLVTDPSNYAPGRRNLWIHKKWDLKDKVLSPGFSDPVLWSLCKSFFPEADLGLVAKGSIRLHRDDSYSSWKACTINLGKCSWEYHQIWDNLDNGSVRNPTAKVVNLSLNGGEIIFFNCKNPHGVSNLDPDRWSINLWNLKDKYK